MNEYFFHESSYYAVFKIDHARNDVYGIKVFSPSIRKIILINNRIIQISVQDCDLDNRFLAGRVLHVKNKLRRVLAWKQPIMSLCTLECLLCERRFICEGPPNVISI